MTNLALQLQIPGVNNSQSHMKEKPSATDKEVVDKIHQHFLLEAASDPAKHRAGKRVVLVQLARRLSSLKEHGARLAEMFVGETVKLTQQLPRALFGFDKVTIGAKHSDC